MRPMPPLDCGANTRFPLSIIRIDHDPGHDQAASYRKGRKKEKKITAGRHEEALLSLPSQSSARGLRELRTDA
jgi:hypothetical protein